LGLGQIDFVVGTTAPQVGTIPTLAIFDTPNAFDTAQTARAVFEDPEFMSIIRAEYYASGYKLLGFADQFYRVMSSNVRINTIADFAGVRIRVMENPFHIAYWQALGASPTPMAFAEVFIGLQQGTIDAQENPHEVIVGASFYEVQQYIINTNHLLHLISLVTNEASFNTMPAHQQQVILDAAAQVIPWARDQADIRVQNRIGIIESAGTTILDISDELKEDIASAIIGVRAEIHKAVGDTIYNAFWNAISRVGQP
ncbi:MAG: TRAP transporter substrate-binding protein, partial [Defluviitaleaceae bacterium]|nr:TRAP transporter substrate-binding protein [Defluviitaleaceae bacterium]